MSDINIIDLRALGKQWGRIVDGRYMEVRRHDGRVAHFDIIETLRTGRPTLVRLLETTTDGNAADPLP